MSNDFYRSFEEKYRGSRDLIKSRLEIYLPFVYPLKRIDAFPKAFDLGCGRGEWLELLGENGFDAYGIDLDDGMLQACQQRMLKIEKKDLLQALADLPESSMSLISGFHIVEHLPFDILQKVIHEAYRVLKPGGIVILETPNAENIIVGTSGFYLDPTHVKPIPHELLSFLAEYSGFYRIKLVRLQENQELLLMPNPRLVDVMYGVSPDYAIVAQKNAYAEVTDGFDLPFSQDYGLGFEELATRFDNTISQMKERLDNVLAETRQANAYTHMILNSHSWRFTEPLRALIAGFRRIIFK
jgi:O-antigen chain-terminating methyltransferase